MTRTLLGQLLLQHGAIDAAALGMALHHQRTFGGRIGDVLVSMGLVSEERLVRVLGTQLQLPVASIGDRRIPPAILKLAPERLLRRHHALPLWIAPRTTGSPLRLIVAFADPQNVAAVDEIAFATGMPVEAVLGGRAEIARALDRHFGGAPRPRAVVPIELCPEDEAGLVLEDRRTRR